jgi:DNA-binding transcriptional LysR family regulator
MKFDERHLVQIAAVVMYGGVTEAARELGLSQPSISRTISMVEARMGEPLFVKGRRPLMPTRLGELVARHGQAILLASRKASESVSSYRQGGTGVVRIGGVPYFMDAFISRMVATLQLSHPDIRVDQSYGHIAELTSLLEADAIDLAITPIGTKESRERFSFTPLLSARNVVVGRSRHPLAGKATLSAEDVLSFSWVAPLPGSPLLLDLHSILLSLGISEVAIRYSGGNLMSVLNYVTETDALAILPHSVVFSLRHLNSLAVIPLEIPQPKRVIGIMSLSDAPISAAVHRVSNHIAAEFASLSAAIERHERSLVWGA